MSDAIWDTIADEASAESSLWAQALLPGVERQLEPVFSPLGENRFALGLETIYEGYLLHYGRPRLFSPTDHDNALLLGDYLYAHGLVRIASFHEVGAVADLAELISLCAQVRAGRFDGDAGPLLALAREAAGDEAVDRALAAHHLHVG